MKPSIEGRYLSTTGTKSGASEVIISKLGDGHWQTQWAASDKPLNQYNPQPEYRVVAKQGWEALALFDGKHLRGFFPSAGNLTLSNTPTNPTLVRLMTGKFEAELQEDGSFAVRLSLWDGKPPKIDRELSAQPNLDWVELTWSKVSR